MARILTWNRTNVLTSIKPVRMGADASPRIAHTVALTLMR